MAGTDPSAYPLQSLAAFTSLLYATAIAPIPAINASRPRPLAAAAESFHPRPSLTLTRHLACLLNSVSNAFSLPTCAFEVMHGGVGLAAYSSAQQISLYTLLMDVNVSISATSIRRAVCTSEPHLGRSLRFNPRKHDLLVYT
ncbi:Ff.00g065350.m01.CDS01 [Fusarium sp. VM40]|nr:Ff.00g065350.m01.CDS01 [Fusarium sp. VM40]